MLALKNPIFTQTLQRENRMPEEYYKTTESVQEYIQLAKGVDGRELIEKLKEVLADNSNILELGSGPGSDWKILSESYKVIGSDFSNHFLKHLKTTYPKGKFIELDAITLETDKNFDGIYSNKVLHHLKDSELVDSIKRQHEVLYSNGIICHSFWKGEGTEEFKGMFVNYHTKTTLEKVFKKYFEVLSIEEYKEFEDNDSLLLVGKKTN